MTMTTSQVSARLRFEVWERTRAQHASLLAHLMDTNTTYEQGAPALSLLSLSLPLHLSPRTPPAPPCHPPLAPFCVPTGKYLAIVAGAVVGKEVRFDAVFQPLVPERLQAFASGGYEASAIAKEFDEHVKRRQKRAFNTVKKPSPTKWAPVHREPVYLLPSPRSVPCVFRTLCGHIYV